MRSQKGHRATGPGALSFPMIAPMPSARPSWKNTSSTRTNLRSLATDGIIRLPGYTDPSNAEHNKKNRRVEVKVFPLESN